MKRSSEANAYLVLVTSFWGWTFPLIHRAIAFMSPVLFVFLRFVLATFLLLPTLRKHKTTRRVLMAGLLLGLLNSATYLFQTIGLETIDPARSAFITGISVILVPFIMPFFRLGWPKRLDVVAALSCLVGLYVLTGANLHGTSVGDFWTLGCAIFWGLTIVVIQWVTPHIKSYQLLNFYQVLFTVPIMGLLALRVPWTGLFHAQVLIALIFCSVFATVIGLYLQLRFQKDTTATKTALIFVLEPLFAAIFSGFLGDIHFTLSLLFGGAIILLSLLLPVLVGGFKKGW